MRALVLAPLAILFCAMVLTVFYLSPSLQRAAIPPPLTAEDARALYGPDTPLGRQLVDRANEILEGIREKCSEHHLQYIGPDRLDPSSVEFSAYSYLREGGIRTVVKFATDEVRIEIGANNKTLIRYVNTALEKRIEDGPCFEPPDQSKLSQKDAAEVATDFLEICPYGSEILFSHPQASFEHTGETPTKTGFKTKQGYWWVRRQRADEQGHPFAGDFSLVTFGEGYGPTFITNSLDTLYYRDDSSPIISQEVATKAAQQFLAVNAGWGGVPFAATNLEKGALLVCRASRNLRNYQSGLDDEGRLAWAQTFGCQIPGSQGGWVSACVDTDAHTGKVIWFGMGSGIGEREK